MSSKLKEKKVIAGIVAVAVVAVALVLTIPVADNGLPDNDVAATVNGEEIMQADVAEMQQMYAAQDMPISEEEVLEQLIRQEVLYQAATEYLPTEEEAVEQLEAQLGMMGWTMEEFRDMLEEEGLCYDEQLKDFRRHLAVQDFLNEEVEVAKPTEEEVREFYEDWKQTLPEEQEPPPFEEVEPEIVMHLQQQEQDEAMRPFIDELIEEADIEYM